MNMFSKQAAIKSAVAVTLMVATFLLLEGLSRIIHTVREDVSAIQPEWFTYSSELGWEKRPLFKGYVSGELQRGNPVRYMREFDQSGFLSVDTLQVATHHHKRILAIGDSNTFGWGVPTQDSFVEVLDDMLPDTDIVNMGVSGYTSFQGYETLARHLESLQPDLVIASFNFNDRRAVPSEDVMDSRGKFGREAILHQTDLLRSNLYLYRTMQYGMSMLGMVNGASNSGPAMDVRQAHVRVPPAKYRQNLKSIARLCKEHNVPLIFIVLQEVQHVDGRRPSHHVARYAAVFGIGEDLCNLPPFFTVVWVVLEPSHRRCGVPIKGTFGLHEDKFVSLILRLLASGLGLAPLLLRDFFLLLGHSLLAERSAL